MRRCVRCDAEKRQGMVLISVIDTVGDYRTHARTTRYRCANNHEWTLTQEDCCHCSPDLVNA